MKRYFIVRYECSYGNMLPDKGELDLVWDCYPSRGVIKERISIKPHKVNILSVTELSEQDYNDYTS